MIVDKEALHQKIALLVQEHRELDKQIQALSQQKAHDEFMVNRLKKRKLLLKDMLIRLRSQLIPDLNA